MLKCFSCNTPFTHKLALNTHLHRDSPGCRSAKKATALVPSAHSESSTRVGRGSHSAPGTMALPTGLRGALTDVTGLASALSAFNFEGGNNGTEVTVVRRHAAERPKAEKVTKALNKQVNALIDASGSMAGSRIKQATDGAINVVDSLNPDRDWFGVATFHSGMTVLHNPVCLKHKSDAHGNKKDELNHILRNYCLEGGGTRMNDAIIDRMSTFVPPPKKGPKLVIQPELIVITDGGDNSSTRSAEETNKFIKDFVAKTPWME